METRTLLIPFAAVAVLLVAAWYATSDPVYFGGNAAALGDLFNTSAEVPVITPTPSEAMVLEGKG